MDNKTFRKELLSARPHLFTIAPLTFWVLCTFVAFNLWIGVSLFIQPPRSLPAIERGFVNNQFYGIVFLAMGLILAWAIKKKNWEMAKLMMMVGLFIKSIFLYALVNIGFVVGFKATLGVLGLWLFAVAVQFGAVVYFSPPHTIGEGEQHESR